MARKLDQILVIDIEATCWRAAPPPGKEAEIIEIGLCMLEVSSGERLTREALIVRPERSTVSPFCTELTTLTQADVDAGVPFEIACRILQDKYGAKKRAWASYGDYDRQQFERQCTDWGIAYPFGPTHINVKNLLALKRRLRREVGMARALDLLKLPLDGTHHRAVDDAWNIASILSRILFS